MKIVHCYARERIETFSKSVILWRANSKEGERKRVDKKRAAWISSFLTAAIIVTVFAYIHFNVTESTYVANTIVLYTYPTQAMELGFYSDQACTQQVGSIDFAEIAHVNPTLWTPLSRTIYIRNEASLRYTLCWNSTLSSISSRARGETWFYIGSRMNPGQVLPTTYSTLLPPYASVGYFNWTLTAWGENT